MVYYKLIFGIIFFCTYTLLLIRAGKKSRYSLSYFIGQLDMLIGIVAGLFLIITAFKG
jgi:general stress protein CsbA